MNRIVFSCAEDFKKCLRFREERARFLEFSVESTFGEVGNPHDTVKKSRSGYRGGVKGKEGNSWPKR
jgi:hypothetical protein